MRISVIVSTYNRPDALSVCLDSLLKQTHMPDEIIVGDDGSGAETSELVRRFIEKSPIPIVHIWQEDKGFRLAAIRNRSVAAAKGDYIIQIDGDIMLHRDFVKDHKEAAKKGFYIKGNRVRLDRKLTEDICRTGRSRVILPWEKGIMSGRAKGLRMPLISKIFYEFFKRDSIWGLGCNMAYWKSDFIAVNGYDESFEGWGREDDDLTHRFARNGCYIRDLRFKGIIYHLWHASDVNQNMENNMLLCSDNDRKKIVRIENGVDKYLIPMVAYAKRK